MSASSQSSYLTEPLSPPPIRPFRCTVCQKSFSRLDHLERHFRSHSQEKPFQCDICKKSFSRSDLLIRHNHRHTNNPNNRDNRQTLTRVRTSKACIGCAEAKLRCQDTRPCERCTKRGMQCVYPPSKNRKAQLNSTQSQTYREQTLHSINPDLCWSQDNCVVDVTDPQHFDTQAGLQADNMTIVVEQNNEMMIGQPYDHDPVTELERLQEQFGSRTIATGLPNHGPDSDQTMHDVGSKSMDQAKIMNMTELDLANPLAGYDDTAYVSFLRNMMADSASGGSGSQINQDDVLTPESLRDIFNLTSDSFATRNFYDPAFLMQEVDNIHSFTLEPESSNSHNSANLTIETTSDGVALGAKAFKQSMWHWSPKLTGERSDKPPFQSSASYDKMVPEPRWQPNETNFNGLTSVTRNHIIASILTLSDTGLAAHIMSSFPSVELLNKLIRNYFFCTDTETDSFIHPASFDPTAAPTELTLALVVAGATMPNVPELNHLGYELHEMLEQLVARLFFEDNRRSRLLGPVQCHILNLDVGLWSGNRRRMEKCEGLSSVGITMFRRSNYFRPLKTSPEPPTHDDTPETLDSKWKKWIECESIKRLAFHLLIRDVQSSMAFLVPPAISYLELSLQLPMSKKLWQASTPNEWKDIYLGQDGVALTSLPSLCSCVDDISLVLSLQDVTDVNLTLLAILSCLWSRTWQCSQRISARKHFSMHPQRYAALFNSALYQDSLELDNLSNFMVLFNDWIPTGLEPATLILYERQLVCHYVSLEDLQVLGGKSGEEEARKTLRLLSKFAGSRESRQAVWHAGQVIRAARSEVGRTSRPSSVVAIYHASLVFWAYAIVITVSGKTESPTLLRNSVNQDVVLLDAPNSGQIQKFLAVGHGVPALSSRSGDEVEPIPLSNPRDVMDAVVDLLVGRYGAESGMEKPALVVNLGRLMKILGQAADNMQE